MTETVRLTLSQRALSPLRSSVCGGLLLLTCAAAGQTSKPTDAQCRSNPKSAGCPAAQGSPGAASSATDPAASKPLNQQFPFPTDDSKGSSAPASGSMPEMPTTGVPDPPASSEQPIHLPPSGSSSSSSSSSDDAAAGSSSSRDDADDDVAPTTASPNAPVKATKLKDLGSHADSSAARAKLELTRITDDLKVGHFYMQDGNTQGAYLRFKDAVEHAPDDPDARFALAEAAGRLNKRDEAVQNYQACLKLDPDGDHDKASRKALQKLGAPAR